MFDKFGEFDSAAEINCVAFTRLLDGDKKAVIALALENGIDKEDAEDYIGGCIEELATPIMAASGKLKVESEDLQLDGILSDWKDTILELCSEDEALCAAVRKKGKELKQCMANLIQFSFENKVQVSAKILKVTKVKHNGKLESFRGDLYLGIPNNVQVKQIIRDYYLGGQR